METNANNLLLSAVDWSDKGADAIARYDFEKAIYCYSEAINLVPTNHKYFSYRSAAYFSIHDAAKALADAEKVISLNPSGAAGYGQKGRAFYELGDFDSSIKAYEHGLSVEPNSAALKQGLAGIKRRAQKYSCPSPASMLEAARAGDLPGINALLRMGCGVNDMALTTDGNDTTPLLDCLANGGYLSNPIAAQKTVQLLIKAGADVNAVSTVGMCVLHYAAISSCPGIVQDLLDAGARPNHGSMASTFYVGKVPPQLVALRATLLNSAEWKQRMADTKALLRGWEKKQKQAKQVTRGGAGAGAGDRVIVTGKGGQCGKARGEEEGSEG